MADEPTPQPNATTPAGPDASAPKADPTGAPNDGAPTQSSPANPANPSASVPTEPLADGTTPTVLQTGAGRPHATAKVAPMGLGRIYRRADVITTLITLVTALVASSLVLGIYIYATRGKTITAPPPKLTTLSSADLQKLGAFFTGNNVGTSSEILTISSASLFKGRVGVNNDLKITGDLSADGPTALGALTVDKVATLGVTNVRGQLTVAGPLTLQSPATLAAGASISGNVTASGNGSFGGSLSAGLLSIHDLTVTGTLNLSGHLAITGQTPTVAPADGAGPSASTSIDGNDSGGTVTVNTGSITSSVLNNGGLLVTVTFRTPYARVPHIIISADGASAGGLSPYVQKSPTGFTIGTASGAKGGTSYSFDYWVVQ